MSNEMEVFAEHAVEQKAQIVDMAFMQLVKRNNNILKIKDFENADEIVAKLDQLNLNVLARDFKPEGTTIKTVLKLKDDNTGQLIDEINIIGEYRFE